MLICADKLSNLRSIQKDRDQVGEEVWSRFRRGKEKQRWYYASMIQRLTDLSDCEMYLEMKGRFKMLFE